MAEEEGGAIGADWAMGSEGAMGAEGAEEDKGASIYTLLDGQDTIGKPYHLYGLMGLWSKLSGDG